MSSRSSWKPVRHGNETRQPEVRVAWIVGSGYVLWCVCVCVRAHTSVCSFTEPSFTKFSLVSSTRGIHLSSLFLKNYSFAWLCSFAAKSSKCLLIVSLSSGISFGYLPPCLKDLKANWNDLHSNVSWVLSLVTALGTSELLGLGSISLFPSPVSLM